MNKKEKLVEVLLFASPDPLNQKKLNQILENEEMIDLKSTVVNLNEQYQKENKGLIIEKIAGGYQILSHPEYHVYIQRLFNKSRKIQLSRPALEALSVIAYRQPVSKAEVESIRGVECGSVISTLMERELITVKGRGSTPGRPLLFGTTRLFLESFGLESHNDLPKLNELNELLGNQSNPELFETDYEIK
ncbi:MAG: SMC-Scp complex subunit ScpB [Candidatus Marinimicrobia bacterium]|nr:SMC-Scp complex subunit ScpB [Candidatus Neomarinimicrobiota bacterium]